MFRHILSIAVGLPLALAGAPASRVRSYDFVEVIASIATSDAGNPFTGAALNGWMMKAGSGEVDADYP